MNESAFSFIDVRDIITENLLKLMYRNIWLQAPASAIEMMHATWTDMDNTMHDGICMIVRHTVADEINRQNKNI